MLFLGVGWVWMLFQGAGCVLNVLSDTFIVLSNTFGVGWVLDGLNKATYKTGEALDEKC